MEFPDLCPPGIRSNLYLSLFKPTCWQQPTIWPWSLWAAQEKLSPFPNLCGLIHSLLLDHEIPNSASPLGFLLPSFQPQ